MARPKNAPAASKQTKAKSRPTKKAAVSNRPKKQAPKVEPVVEQDATEKPSEATNIDTEHDSKDDKSAENEEYDEEEDDDYDPSKKPDTHEDEEDSDASDDGEPQPDYSTITTEVSQVRTRNQIYRESTESKYGSSNGSSYGSGLRKQDSRIDVDAIFSSLQSTQTSDDWASIVRGNEDTTQEKDKKTSKPETSIPENDNTGTSEEKIRIFTTYTFAGKLVREEKIVDANSAEAKAYLNSTNGLTNVDDDSGPKRSYVTVLRKIPNSGDDTEQPLRIKLKRPSLIDKFLLGDKRNKLTTLEKSRLDWASFVDKKNIKDDLAIHNKGGYLEKQDFLGRMEHKRDTQYQQAKELERQRQWQQQQQQPQRS